MEIEKTITGNSSASQNKITLIQWQRVREGIYQHKMFYYQKISSTFLSINNTLEINAYCNRLSVIQIQVVVVSTFLLPCHTRYFLIYIYPIYRPSNSKNDSGQYREILKFQKGIQNKSMKTGDRGNYIVI